MTNYNRIASKYDELFLSPDALKENNQIRDMIAPYVTQAPVIDIGCGTGLYLDMFPHTEPKDYFGIDPSIRMLNRLLEKHPGFEDSLLCAKYEQMRISITFPQPNVRISLFGSINYVERNTVLFSAHPKYFYMFYREDYVPVTYTKTGLKLKHYGYTIAQLQYHFKNVFPFNNFNIATNLF